MINEFLKNNNESSNSLSGIGSIIMDMQESLLTGIDRSEELIDSVVLSVNLLSALKIPICLTEQVPEKLGITIHRIKNTDLTGPVFSKNTFSAFGCISFNEWINTNNISHLLISGIETPICIYQTCVEALRKGLKVTVLSDCVGARRIQDSKAIIAQLQSFGCCVIPIESVVYSLIRDSMHPSFKEITKLVRARS